MKHASKKKKGAKPRPTDDEPATPRRSQVFVAFSFENRLTYLRWLAMLREGTIPTHADIARALGITPETVNYYSRRSDAPKAFQHIRALVHFFNIGGHEVWVADGTGPAPEPEMWAMWNRHREAALALDLVIAADAREEIAEDARSQKNAARGLKRAKKRLADLPPEPTAQPPSVGAAPIPVRRTPQPTHGRGRKTNGGGGAA